jgi:nucleoside-diphosphate-sugar epimerase
MRVFVSGGTGFIGAYVVPELLLQGHEVLLFGNRTNQSIEKLLPSQNVLIDDMSTINEWWPHIRQFKPEAALHLAWEGIPDYSFEMSHRNLQYGLALYRRLIDCGCTKIVTTGSCWEYGQFQGCLKESDAIMPFNAFTAAKNALHFLGKEMAAEACCSFIWSRLFYVYGPGQRPQSLIPYLIDCASKGKEPALKSGDDHLDFIYVKDVAEALVKMINQDVAYEIYNVGSGNTTAVNEIVQMIKSKFHLGESTKQQSPGTDPSERKNFCADITFTTKHLTWKPSTSLGKGIDAMIKTIEPSL